MTPVICDVDIEKWERRLIRNLKRRGFQLLNMTDGGDGVPGNKQSAETKLKKSLALKGRKRSPETIEKMRVIFSKEVHMYDGKTNVYLKSFLNSGKAGEFIGAHKSSVSYAVK